MFKKHGAPRFIVSHLLNRTATIFSIKCGDYSITRPERVSTQTFHRTFLSRVEEEGAGAGP